MTQKYGRPPRLALLDGHGIIFRAYFAQKDNPLSVKRTGEVVSAVFGFTNTLLRVISDLKPTHIAVTMDRSAPTFRHEKDETYKANRAAMPDDLRPQVKRVRQLVEAFNIPIFAVDGFEADDCLGTLAKQAAAQGIETWLVTLDSDICQLVQDHVKVFMFRPYQRDVVRYETPEQVKERYGVLPSQIPDLKGLKGDSSDNIPGVPGIGEKTAAKLLQTFPTLETIYDFLHQVTPARIQEALRAHEEQARHSKMMATIVSDCPINLDLDACRVEDYDRDTVLQLFQELEFQSLVRRLGDIEAIYQPERPDLRQALAADEPTYTAVTDERTLQEVVGRIRAAGAVAFDTETTSQSAMEASLVGISLSVKPYEAWYIPVGHVAHPGDPQQLPQETVLDWLRPVLEDPTIAKIAHNAKYDITVLANHGVLVQGLSFDTMVAAYLLGETALGLKALAFDRLGVEMTPITDLIGAGRKQITMDQTPIAQCAAYACADADITIRLRGIFEGELRERALWELFQNPEVPLITTLSRMERTGVALDPAVLREMSAWLSEEMKRTEAALYEAAGESFNINSPLQLSRVLFEKLALPKTRKTASGYSTDAQAMDSLRGTHPVVDLLFEYRGLAKLKSTYVDALPGMVNQKTGRIHTNYNQTRAATGRLSSEDPNLQNIPIRTEQGRRVRRAFVARSDAWTRSLRALYRRDATGGGRLIEPGEPTRFLSADYSQVELRILAHISKEPFLLEAFRQDEDIHRATAARLFDVASTDVTYDQRQLAKTINFAVLYGLSAQGLSQRTEMSRAESADFIRTYFETYPLVKRYLDETVATTRRDGYATTLLGRRRYLPDINSSNFNLRQAAERMATNHPIQGTNADIIKIAMNRILAELDARGLRSRMILQVHDDLVFECPDDEVDDVCRLALDLMPAAMTLDVPLKVEVKAGRNWGEMEAIGSKS